MGFIQRVIFLLLTVTLVVSQVVHAQEVSDEEPTLPPVDEPSVPLAPVKPAAAGLASYYHSAFHGRRTANGETFNQNALTAAHRTLPFGTLVRVINLRNQRSVIVRVNDRGPVQKSRVIDVTPKAARELGFFGSGMAQVKLEVVAPSEAANLEK
ncbi:MAG: septal ring lytic transglycosylase RlpA family protein [Deltaproteobacteria bacterium]|nr:septal ring lytic transglycosylase RlpA family protein [Deltaproteobacteria bacterium]